MIFLPISFTTTCRAPFQAQVPPGALPGQVIQIAAPVAPVVVGAPMGAWETEAGNLPETLEAAEFGFKGFPT